MNVLIQQYFQQNLSLIFPDLVLPNHFRYAWACILAGPRSSESPATPLVPESTTSAINANLEPRTTYTFVVSAVNGLGSGPRGSDSIVTPSRMWLL